MKYLISSLALIFTLILGNSSMIQADSVKWCVVNNATGKVGQCYRMKQICENSIKSVKNYYSCVAR
ncbi:hypothetical protein OAK51_02620 [Alphaproteobacteria bacterium]|nr:hypothetical protein [Alphaproteobacteria bacterium]